MGPYRTTACGTVAETNSDLRILLPELRKASVSRWRSASIGSVMARCYIDAVWDRLASPTTMSTQVDGALPGKATLAVHSTRFAAPAQGCQQILVRRRPAAQLGVITYQPPEIGVRVAIWVAVHRRSAQFNGVRAHGLSCGANATEPKGTCSAQALIRGSLVHGFLALRASTAGVGWPPSAKRSITRPASRKACMSFGSGQWVAPTLWRTP